jgi:hypothetical protein
MNIHVGAGFGRDSDKLAVYPEIEKASFELLPSEPTGKAYCFIVHAKPGKRFGNVDAFAACISLIAVYPIWIMIFNGLNGEDAVKRRIQRDRVYHGSPLIVQRLRTDGVI